MISPVADRSRVERLLVKIIAIRVLDGRRDLLFYQHTLLLCGADDHHHPPSNMLSAALLIAFLIVLLSLGFKQYVRIQSQPRDRFMLGGLGAVALGFSLFLSFLFLFKIGDWYSRGTFFTSSLASALQCSSCVGGRTATSGTQFSPAQSKREGPSLSAMSNRTLILYNALNGKGSTGLASFRFLLVHGHPVSGVEVFSPGIRSFVERCRGFKPDDIIFLAETADLPRIAALVGLCRSCRRASMSSLPHRRHFGRSAKVAQSRRDHNDSSAAAAAVGIRSLLSSALLTFALPRIRPSCAVAAAAHSRHWGSSLNHAARYFFGKIATATTTKSFRSLNSAR